MQGGLPENKAGNIGPDHNESCCPPKSFNFILYAIGKDKMIF